jgi:NAD(P)-dependent dehydrogenase (short-subunit alcohol dehydrogenase family)
MESLDGRVALVTGAARGIGRGIAAVVLSEGADAAGFDNLGPEHASPGPAGKRP